jgi:hypothetical protein
LIKYGLPLLNKQGVSVEGSVIVERQDANALAYNSTVTVKSLLSGSVSQPDWAASLYQALQESITPRGNNQTWINDSAVQPHRPTHSPHHHTPNHIRELITLGRLQQLSARQIHLISRTLTPARQLLHLVTNLMMLSYLTPGVDIPCLPKNQV